MAKAKRTIRDVERAVWAISHEEIEQHHMLSMLAGHRRRIEEALVDSDPKAQGKRRNPYTIARILVNVEHITPGVHRMLVLERRSYVRAKRRLNRFPSEKRSCKSSLERQKNKSPLEKGEYLCALC